MSESQFPFVRNDVLRKNLDQAFQHVVILLGLSESEQYNREIQSVFRETVIIYTASIIEALLFYLIKSVLSETDFSVWQWELKKKNTLYVVDEKCEIVAGTYQQIEKKTSTEKMNLGQINTLLKEKNVINKTLFNKIDYVRVLRNKQHLGTQKIVKSYSRRDLDDVFEVARLVKNMVRKES